MSKGAKVLITVIVILVVGWIVIRYNKKAPVASGEPIKIGFIGPLTGDAAVYGEPGRDITKLAVKEINDAGGVNGRPLEVIFEDGKCAGPTAVSAAQKLISVDKVQAILGGFCSSESLAAEPVATAAKVFLFSPGSSSPDLTGKSEFFARDYPSDASQGKVLADAAKKEGWKNVAFIQEQLDYPLGIYKAFTATFEKNGGTVTKQEFNTKTTDFRSIIAKAKALNADAIFVDTQTPASAERVIKQIAELGWKPHLMVSDVTSGDPETVTRNATALEGALAAEFGVDPTSEKFKHMVDAYKQMYGKDAPYLSYGQTEYDSVYLLRDAILAVGYDGAKITQWMHNVKDWEGASGKVTIGADGDRIGGHTLKEIKNGKTELYTE